jgi:hypothetical protein
MGYENQRKIVTVHTALGGRSRCFRRKKKTITPPEFLHSMKIKTINNNNDFCIFS